MQQYLAECRSDFKIAFEDICDEQKKLLSVRSFSEEGLYDFRYGLRTIDKFSHGSYRVEALLVVPYGRFGNLVVQITHALDVAKHLGIRKVYVDLGSQQRGVFTEDEICSIGDVSLLLSFSLSTSENCLVGRFWHLAELVSQDMAFTRDVTPSREMFALLSPDIRTKVSNQVFSLAVHIRAGDLFTEKNINSHYAQPPVCFYQKAVSESVRPSHEAVALVFEDNTNPTVKAMKDWFDAEGIPYVAYSSSLKDDLAILLSAREIVSSFGTFIPAVMKISPNLRRLYSFDSHYARQDRIRFRPDIDLIEYQDVGDLYTKPGEWCASVEQLQIMLDYPSSLIGRKA